MKLKLLIFSFVTALLLGYGFCQAMYIAPTEQTMGDVQRIFYYHLPSAWICFTLFMVNFFASIWYLIRRTAGADALAQSAAEVGVVFCSVVLISGPLWAKPIWGIWWTWDVRLTSTLVLWLIYVSYLILRRYSPDGTVEAAVLAIFGFLDVPLVYMAIRWFRTQHPQPVIGGGRGSGLDHRMWVAVLWNLAAFLALGILLTWQRYRLAMQEKQLEAAHAEKAISIEARSVR
ncbi:MAG TPA: cytochrome c biogenesis protein CcsA [Terriglobales bacterium]